MQILPRLHRLFVVLAAPLLFCGSAATAAPSAPEWIWLSREVRPNQVTFFRKTFTVDGEVASAILVGGCDNEMTMYLNGDRVALHASWESPARLDLTKKMRRGENVIAVEGRNDNNPHAGLIAEILVVTKDGKKRTLVTDRSWLVSSKGPDGWRTLEFKPVGWTEAFSFGRVGVDPWGSVGLPGTVPISTSEATGPDRIQVAKDFRVELIYSVPKTSEGSWVAMTPDPRGRLIVSDQSGPLYRVSVGRTAGDTKVERLPLKIGEAQGLLWAYDSLYVTVNGGAAQGSGLYRCRDTDGDGDPDHVMLVKKLEGGGEHGPHGIRLGPDGKLYIVAGNFTRVPTPLNPESPHRNWAEDLLLPRNPDGGGHDPHIMAPGGWVARTDPDGRNWQLVAAGMRNSYDIDFSTDGELFTFDSDMEWDTGTPWYRPTRVNHVVSGAEFGWRNGTGKWPAFYPDSLGAVVDVGLGSPTGVAFGTGAKFPARYQRALFINDWTFGKIYAVHLRPAGASYTADFEVFVEGRPLPVTDVCVNHDGALYFAIGGRGTQSGLYRVTYVGDAATGPAGPSVDSAAAAARALRRRLEAFHGRKDARAIATAWPHLESTDRSIRYAARVAIEHQDLEHWQEKALSEPRTTARINALVALARVAPPELQPRIVARLNELSFPRMGEPQLLEAMRAYGLAFIRLGKPDASVRDAAVARLNPLFPTESDAVSREVVQLLVYLEAPSVVERAMARLKKAQTQEEQLHYVFVLRNLGPGWTLDQRRAYFSWLQIAETSYRGGASFRNFLARIREDAMAKLSADDKTALADVLEGRRQVESVETQTTRQFVHNWQWDDLAPAIDQAESGRSFERGRIAYQAAQCYKCHRFAGEGGATGPDLTGVGGRFSGRDLLESIVLPSKVVSDQYRSSIVRTTEGETITGRVIEEDDRSIKIRTDPFARQLVEIAKPSIDVRLPSPTSEMPEGAINVLTKAEILDLIAYLRSGGNAGDKAFRK